MDPVIKYTTDADPLVFALGRAHATDAGADLRTVEDIVVPAHESRCIKTGTHIELPDHTAGLLVSKSGLNVVNCLTSTGLIDEGYTGEIKVRVYNHSDLDYRFDAGDKVSQLVVIPVLYPTYVYAESIEGGERGDAGFGSTGR